MESTDKAISNDAATANGNVEADVNALATKFGGFTFLNNLNNAIQAEPLCPEVERRLKALKKMQVELFNAECKFFEELHDLEIKYADIHKATYNKRNQIIAGKYEPTDEECEFAVPDVEEKTENEDKKNANSGEVVSGIPKFWLTIFQNVRQFADMIEDHDIPILEHLEDVTLDLIKEPMGFRLSFHFSPNDYFTNSVLTKTYDMRIHVDPKEPLIFEGTEIYKSTGCKINWKDGKDVTVREVKKKQKHKSTGAIRMTSKFIENPSFFEFFSPPQIDENDETAEQSVQEKVTEDFELGSFLKERVIPRAVLYYTGEALESDDEDDEEDFTSDGSEEEEESGDEGAIHESETDNEDEGNIP